MDKSFNLEVLYEGEIVEIVVHSYYLGCPAQLYGPMEDCYPEEYPEVEFTVVNKDLSNLKYDEGFISTVIDTITCNEE